MLGAGGLRRDGQTEKAVPNTGTLREGESKALHPLAQ